MQYNPNFPHGLSILPSERYNLYPVVKTDDPHDGEDYIDQEKAIQQFGIAGRIWEAAYILDQYIAGASHLQFEPPFKVPEDQRATKNSVRYPRTIIELGSGTGVTARSLSRALLNTPLRTVVESEELLPIVVATDLPAVCPLLESNLRGDIDEHPEQLFIRPLEWGNRVHVETVRQELDNMKRPITDIICSDLVYFPELLAPLLRTLIHLTTPDSSGARQAADTVNVTISYKIRSLAKETPFWSAFGLWFHFEPVLSRTLSPRRRSSIPSSSDPQPFDTSVGKWTRFGASHPDGPIFIFVARRKLESFEWAAHLNRVSDDDLMRGWTGSNVTAYTAADNGGMERRTVGDDTFERMLMMMMFEDDREEEP